MSGGPSTTVSPLTLILSVIAGLYVIWNYRAPTWSAVLREPPLNLTSSVSSTVEAEDTLEECSRRALIGPSGEADGPRGKKVYIDLGANDGSSLKYFFTEFAPDKLGEPSVSLSEWEAYLFDLNPLWKDDLRARCASFIDLARCEVILAGAWNSTKTIGEGECWPITKDRIVVFAAIYFEIGRLLRLCGASSLSSRCESAVKEGTVEAEAFLFHQERFEGRACRL
ncbi:hypothetical protein FOL46_007262 [Perkinsus olseni]|uniref:Uncharacterized protein n=1 Tax=Perkinsus olseni TaxID=32597 RepID=A0A7J6LF83_PEROL|nr:hypothetical protein FOL46_007262 [Perkinsus olseni]